jgi:hypothetical protein
MLQIPSLILPLNNRIEETTLIYHPKLSDPPNILLALLVLRRWWSRGMVMHRETRLAISELCLYVGAVFDVLVEVADVAADFLEDCQCAFHRPSRAVKEDRCEAYLPRLERERDQGNEAEGEPLPKTQTYQL